jgi:LmbE family N-acetylglucosaminyl deacetylase
VVLEQQQADLVGRRREGLDLLQQIQAIGLFVNQPLQPTGLALDPPQAVEQLLPILGVRVAEVLWWHARIGSRHTAGQYAPEAAGSVDQAYHRGPMNDLERAELLEPLERALVIFSHPDDAEFTAAPTIAALTGRGVAVHYVVTTDGGKGTDDPAVTPEQLAATRIAEQRAAADILGVSEIVHLGYPDGYLTPSLDLRRDIVRQIRRFQPHLVIAQNWQRRADGNPFIAHPDHLATGEATLAAVYPAARDRLNFPELARDEGLEPWKVRQVLVSGVERPNLWMDVSETFDVGLQAMRCHVSQFDDWADVESRFRERIGEVGEPVGLPMAQAFLSIDLS